MGFTLRFEARKDTINKDGKVPVSIIVSVSGKRKRIKTDIRTYYFNWDQGLQRAVFVNRKKIKELNPEFDPNNLPSSMDIEDINQELVLVESRFRDLAKKFELDNIAYGVQSLCEAFLLEQKPKTIKEESSKYVLDYIEKYIRENEAKRARGSMSVYKSLKGKLEAYLKKSRISISFEKIDLAFFRSFENYLIKEGEINNITIAKQLSTLKTFLNYASMDGIKVNDSWRAFKITRQTLEVIALTEKEFLTLYNLDLSNNKKLDKVRDVFCFGCATGYRYSDLNQLRRGHIYGMEIRLTVQKTQKPLMVPLNKYAYEILEKYKEMEMPLPVISNQKMNDYLKDLGKLAEINEPIEIVRYRGANKVVNIYPKYDLLTVHVARKTFATLSLEKGIPVETVMSVTGHSSYSSFQRYVKVTEERKRKEMARAWGAPELKKVVGGADQ
ncbi:site-specific integrase [Cecembia rubra]|uniref:Site-specific recombinase XerD n=1 Tax=Cecembia rubra TaxID=1485585 RepID=A0A2P8E341_9BACT|nr:site-specific integrase [Cecembia rubra]PSL03874.1 site-specific recombinase XerD [Cecembia rubra]